MADILSHPVGPIVSSDEARNAELNVSLLERLFERSLYADDPQARSRIFSKITTDYESNFAPLTNLVKVCHSIVCFIIGLRN
jgi:hypothetical protein